MSAATYASVTRSLNPNDDFVLHGESPYYIERTVFRPTNSDLTSTTRNLSQHEYRSDLYKDVLDDDRPLRGSLRNMSRILQRVSNSISKTLLEDSTAKGALSRAEEAGQDATLQTSGTQTTARPDDRRWLTDSEWYTTSGHHVTFKNNVPTISTFRPISSSLASPDFYRKTSSDFYDAGKNFEHTDRHLSDVPVTRFTRKDLLESEYFPITMSCKTPYGKNETHRRSRSRTRAPRERPHSSEGRSRSFERKTTMDNYRAMKGLEKLYTVASEAPGIASATIAIMSPYQEEMARLRLERLRLEEEHLQELKRLSELEKMRGPKPKWYELKDTRFHYEAAKNNELLRSQDSWDELMKKREMLKRASEDFQNSLASRSQSAMSAYRHPL